ncbi:MAG: hypothetical protein AAF668_14570 [Pseudomonadota bacterium]
MMMTDQLSTEARQALTKIIAVDVAIIALAVVIYLNTHDVLHLVVGCFVAGGVTVPLLVRWADKYGRGGKRQPK